MTALLRRHEYREEKIGEACVHCGSPWHPQMTATCLQRAIPQSELAPEPKRREMACEDAETISARLTELAKERLPV